MWFRRRSLRASFDSAARCDVFDPGAAQRFVGEIDTVDATPVEALIREGYIPVIAPLGEDLMALA